jgi:uncharacterized repeat protein (TIGR01451 family)
MMYRSFKRLFRKWRAARPRRWRRVWLYVEPLEERIMLDAGLPPALVVGRTLSSGGQPAYFAGDIQNNLETITYTVYNEQTDPLQGVLLTDTLQPGVTFQSASQPPDQSGPNLAWSLGSINGFDRASITLTVKLTNPTPMQLDTGARAFAVLDGAAVSNSTPAATLRAGNAPAGLLASTPDANTTDPFVQEQAARLNYDPQQIFNFLQQDIGYNSYLGSVRGARGTLWSSAGNALDVASLGVALMRASGIPAQYEQGKLSQGDAQQLIRSMFPNAFQLSGFIPAGTQTVDPAADPQLLAETEQHYYWFQFDAGGGMKDADPLKAGATIGQTFTASTGSFAEVPDNLREKAEIQVVAETLGEFDEVLGAPPSQQVVLDQTFNDVDLVGHPLSIGNQVSTQAMGLGITQVVYTYSPYLTVGDEAFPDQSHDQIIQGTNYQEVYSNEPLVSIALTGLFLNVTLSGPQGPPETFQHTIFDRLGFAGRQNPNNLNVSFDTSTQPAVTPFDATTVNVLPGLQDPNVIRPQTSQLAPPAAQLKALNSGGTIADNAQFLALNTVFSVGLARWVAEQMMSQSDLLTSELATLSEVVAYFDRPRINVMSQIVDPKTSALSLKADLMADAIRATAFPGQTVDTPLTFNVTRGFTETAVETQAVASVNPNATVISTQVIFQAAQQQGIPTALLQGSGDIAQLDTFGLDPDSTARIAAALQAGQIVVVPTAPVLINGQPTTGWFQIDPTTGYMTSVGPDGSHFGLVEIFWTTVIVASLYGGFLQARAAQGAKVAVERVALLAAIDQDLVFAIPRNGESEQALANVELPVPLEDGKDEQGRTLRGIASSKVRALQDADSIFLTQQAADDVQKEIQLKVQELTSTDVVKVWLQRHQGSKVASILVGGDPSVLPELWDERIPQPQPSNQSTAFQTVTAGTTAGTLSTTITVPNVATSGQLVATWSTAATSAFEVTSLNAASATVTKGNSQMVGSGAVGLSAATAVGAAISGNNQYSINGSGTLSFYGPAEANLGVSGNWSSYAATVTGTVSITLTTDGLTVNGQTLPAGTYTITTSSATLGGSGPSTSPNFSGAASLNVTGGTVTLGTEKGSITLGGTPLDLSNGATLDGYSGSVTVAASGGNTDTVTLNGNTTNVLTVSATPATLTTDQNTPKTFQVNVNTSLTDKYTLIAKAPPGWTVAIDTTGKVTVTPAPGLQGGTVPIQIIAQSQTNLSLLAQTTVNVTVTPTAAGETLNVITDPLLTVPVNGANLPTAFQVRIHNNGPAPVTEDLAFSNVPSGFTLFQSATRVTIPAGQTGIVGVYLVPTGNHLPPAGSSVSFTVTATNAAKPGDKQQFDAQFTVPAVDSVALTSNVAQVSSTPGTPVDATLSLQNTGNADETVTLAASGSAEVTVGGLNQELVPRNQTVTVPITLTPAASAPLNSTLDTTITATFGPTANPQTTSATISVQVVSQQVVALAQAANAAGQANNSQLADNLTNLQNAVAQLQTTPTDATALGQVQLQLANLNTLLGADPALAFLQAPLQALQAEANAGNVSGLLNGLPGFFGTLSNILTVEATEQYTVSLSPTTVDLQTGQSQTVQVQLTNTGTNDVPLTLSTSGVPTGVTAQLAQTQLVLPAGQTQTVNVTLTQTQDINTVFALKVTAAAAVVQQSATAGVAVRPATADVVGVTATPQLVASAGDTVAVTAQVFNTANVSRQVQAQIQILDLSGNILETLPTVPVNLVPGTGNLTVDLGTIDTTGLANGVYFLRVWLLAGDGSDLPGQSAETLLGVGPQVTASVAASTAFVPPGTSSVSTTITVTNQRSVGPASTTVGDIQAFYLAKQTFGMPQLDQLDGPVFVFENTSGADITNGVFTITPVQGQPADSFNVGTIPAGGRVFVIPGVSNDGGSGHTFFNLRGSNPQYVLDTSDIGLDSDQTQFEFTGQQGGAQVDTGVFTPAATDGPSNNGVVANANFLGGPNHADGHLAFDDFGPKIVATMTAGAPPNLWIGTDNAGAARNILNTDLSGTVLRTINSTEGTGFAIDQANNILYVGASNGVITPYNLTTLIPGTPFTPAPLNPGLAEDMTFDDSHIWRTSSGGTVTEIDPASHQVLSSFNTGFEALGITSVAGNLVISNTNGDIDEFDTSGHLLGTLFTVNFEAGGVAFDAADSTFYIGTLGKVHHFSESGTELGSFDIPASQDASRFIDGLEFVAPSSGVSVAVTHNLPASGYTVDGTSINPAPTSSSASQLFWNASGISGTAPTPFQLSGTVANMAPGEVRPISTGTTVIANISVNPSFGPPPLFVTEFNTPGITQLDAATGNSINLLNSSQTVDSLVFDQSGDIVYTEFENGKLGIFNPKTNSNKILATLPGPADLALDPDGKSVVVNCEFDQTTKRVDLNTGDVTTLASNILPGTPGGGIAYDEQGHLFVANNNVSGSTFEQLDPNTGAVLQTISLNARGQVDGVTFDPVTQSFWIADFFGHGLIEVSNYLTSSPKVQEFFAPSGFVQDGFDGIESDGQGNIFIADFDQRVEEYNIAANKFSVVPGTLRPDDVAPLIGAGSQQLTQTINLPPLSVAAEHIINLTPPTQSADRNATATYTVTLTNPLPTDVTYNLSVDGLDGFTTNIAPSVTVPAGQTVDVPLQVTVPVAAATGLQVFDVVAQTDQGAKDSVEGQLTVNAPVDLPTLGVHVDVQPAQATAGADAPARYTVTVANVGEVTDTYNLSITPPPSVTASFSQPTVTVAPGESSARSVTLTLTPVSGTQAASYPFEVTATSTTDATVKGAADATVQVVAQGVQVSLTPATANAGTTFDLKVTNTGSVADTFDLALAGPAAIGARLSTTKVTLLPQASQDVQVTTSAASFAVPGKLPLIGMATSEANPKVQDSARAAVIVPETVGMTAGLTPTTQVLPIPGTSSFLLLVTNTGNTADDYKATITGTTGPITASLLGLDGQPTQTIADFQLPALATGAILIQTNLGTFGTGTVAVLVQSLTHEGLQATNVATVSSTAVPVVPGAAPTIAGTPVNPAITSLPTTPEEIFVVIQDVVVPITGLIGLPAGEQVIFVREGPGFEVVAVGPGELEVLHVPISGEPTPMLGDDDDAFWPWLERPRPPANLNWARQDDGVAAPTEVLAPAAVRDEARGPSVFRALDRAFEDLGETVWKQPTAVAVVRPPWPDEGEGRPAGPAKVSGLGFALAGMIAGGYVVKMEPRPATRRRRRARR